MTEAFLITCEHGGNRIPAAYLRLFRARHAVQNSRRDRDPGALVMAKALAGAFAAPLVSSTISRLLIDLNRSIGHPELFSETMRGDSRTTRMKIPEQHCLPYRAQVELLVGQSGARGLHVVHVSSRSLTPELDGKVRGARSLAYLLDRSQLLRAAKQVLLGGSLHSRLLRFFRDSQGKCRLSGSAPRG